MSIEPRRIGATCFSCYTHRVTYSSAAPPQHERTAYQENINALAISAREQPFFSIGLSHSL
jgi:hypothetical protein